MNIPSIKSLLLAALAVTALSCTLDNDRLPDPSVEQRSIPGLLRSATVQATFNQHSLPARTAGILMQYLDRLESSIFFVENYDIPASYMEAYWSSGLYRGSLKTANDLLQLSQELGDTDAEGIAHVILALEFANATTSFGDIPYSQALGGSDGIIKPVLDPQQEVYLAIIEQLTEAIALLSVGGNPLIAEADFLHGGDIAKWKKLAHGLRARYGNHLLAKGLWSTSQVLADIDQSYKSHDEQGKFQFLMVGNIEHPIRSFVEQRPSTVAGNPDFLQSLTERNDPRNPFYFATDGGGNIDIATMSSDLVWTSRNSVLPWLSFAELQFIKAEILVLTGAADVQISEALQSAIAGSLDQMGINSASHQEFVEQYGTVSIGSTNEQKLQQIIEEAYYSYYGYAWQQAWSNYRRTGYPELPNTGSPNENNRSGTLPERYLYPQEVKDLNLDNFQEAEIRQSGAFLDTPLWIFED